MTKTLRPYQQEALQKTLDRIKEIPHPLLVNASVGAGKSLIISELLLSMESKGWKCLCLTLNSTLIEQNAETYRLQGGHPGIYCSSLNLKDDTKPVTFASPNSIVRNYPDVNYNMIVIDEAHNINPDDDSSMYMRILNHYGHRAQQDRYEFRIVGLTGTPFRGKGVSILGSYFKEEVCNIPASWLIKEGYLAKPSFSITSDNYDFSNIRVNNLGKFSNTELQSVIDKNERLTGKIMRELTTIKHNGIFIFAATRKHCIECAKSLPDGEWAIITGETPHNERKKILHESREGNIKYLISVNCLNVGVDVPNFDACAWLRPTESLVLYTQGIGRALRLFPGKLYALVLDYAGNLTRHGDVDDPIINEALQPREENEKDYCIPCYTCGTHNTVNTRRCIGIVASKRCDHYFEFKKCERCGLQNDITSRICRGCGSELIDPNKKLSFKNRTSVTNVKSTTCYARLTSSNNYPLIMANYITDSGDYSETFVIKDERTRNIAYAKFVRNHIKNPSRYYMNLFDINKIRIMLQEENLIYPVKLVINEEGNVVKKVF